MDTVTIIAARGGWDVQAFIRRVQNDTTFYKAFRSLHVVSYVATNDIKVFDKNNKVKASLFSHTKQTVSDGCRTMQTLDEKVTGDFYRHNKQYNYYTAELYDYFFFIHGRICGDDDIVAGHMDERGKGQLEKSKLQLKKLMFDPGAKVNGIPFMGDRASIFDDKTAKLYDFKLLSENYNGQDCYVFKAILKKGEEKNVVYNELTTWFRKTDYSIVARNYSLSYHTMFYDFDVQIKVRTTQKGKKLLPAYVNYAGNWHIFTKKREMVNFTILFNYE
jgi:hypothetical protein